MLSKKFLKSVKAIILLLTVIQLIILFSISVSAGIRVTPARFVINLEPGKRDTGLIKVSNNTEKEVDLTAVYYDWSLDDKNEMVLYNEGTLKESLDGLIKFNPKDFTLKPGQEQMVRFTVSMPDNEVEEPYERRGVIFFEHIEEFNQQGMGSSVRSMIGSTVYVRPATYELAFNVNDSGVAPYRNDRFWAGFKLSNECKAHIRFKTEYKIIDSEHRLIEEGNSEENVILPGMERTLLFPLKTDFQPGSYKMLASFNFDATDEVMRHTIDFNVE